MRLLCIYHHACTMNADHGDTIVDKASALLRVPSLGAGCEAAHGSNAVPGIPRVALGEATVQITVYAWV